MLLPNEKLTQVLSYRHETGNLTLALVNEKDQIRKAQSKAIGVDLTDEDVQVRVSMDKNILEELETMNLSSRLLAGIKGVAKKEG
ncbi:hypothetical protein [Vibrio sp. 10N.239.312.D08]|uniref:hypothetical protein n=1 Tax=Vibrio sp. 10N.239.312.D08 TaxID=3229978 RepID=UPI00354C10C0